ncbi:putative thiosulfate sulfurtransferase, mitochondrial [Plutella xylostella]|uniref:putative thiosulfate sulfurtransferase, mitochondrial n=1 Tax=Plutella xylostella TaxID=51655 RepID=UPI002032B34E|nr:putative thiosulfate sulfurtransferase, mitochondrial [Plutella xylostella]
MYSKVIRNITLLSKFKAVSQYVNNYPACSSSLISTINTSPQLLVAARRQYSNSTPEEMIVDFDYVKKASAAKNKVIIDVREPDEIKEHGKIPNSINIPLGDVSSALSTLPDKEFEKLYGTKKPAEDAEIIFYCMIGKRSGMAQQNAISLGFKNARNYLGSWTDWARKSN